MGTIYNNINCVVNRKNVGYGDCVLEPKQVIGIFKVPGSFRLDATDLQSVEATIAKLRQYALYDNKGNRIYPVMQLKNPQNNSDDKTVQAFSDGTEAVVREGLQKWMHQVTAGGLGLHSALRTHNENGGYILILDAAFTLYGWSKNKGEIWGVPLNWFWADAWRPNDGANVANFSFGYAFNPVYLNEAVGYCQLNTEVLGISGLKGIQLTEYSFDDATGVVEVNARLENGGTNMADLYGTELAAAGLWKASNAETGSAITVQTVTVVGAGESKRFQITLDDADADYPAAGSIILSMAAPSVLDAAGVEGYESDELTLTTGSSS